MRVFVVIPPEPVVSLAEAKLHLRVDGSDEDALIEGYVAAATAHIDGPDGWLGRAVGVQTLEARCDSLTCGNTIRLPFPPVIEPVSISYLDADDVEDMADLADIELLGADLMPTGGAWPWAGGSSRREGVRIRYRAGYDVVPPAIRAAVLLMTGDLYRNRESVTEGNLSPSQVPMSTTIENLLAPYRVYR